MRSSLRGSGAGDVGRLRPARRSLLFTTAGGTAAVWRRRTGGSCAALPQPGPVVRGVFDPSGTLVATIAIDAKAARASRASTTSRTGRLLHVLPQIGVQDARVQPRRVAARDRQPLGAVDLWRAPLRPARAGARRRRQERPRPRVHARTGALLATAVRRRRRRGSGRGRDRRAALPLPGPHGGVVAVAWSRDGRRARRREPRPLARLYAVSGLVESWLGHRDAAREPRRREHARVRPGRAALATGGVGGGVRLWDATPRQRLRPCSASTAAPVATGLVLARRQARRLRRRRRDGADLDVRRPPAPARAAHAGGGHRRALQPGRQARRHGERGRRRPDLARPRRARSSAASAARRRCGSRASAPTGASSPPAPTTARCASGGRATDGALHVLRVGGPVTDAAFSPDGRTLATASTRGAALWSVADGRLLHGSACRRRRARRVLARRPPARDRGRRADGALLDVPSGRLLHVLSGHKPGVDRHRRRLLPRRRRRCSRRARDPDGRTWAVPSGAPLPSCAASSAPSRRARSARTGAGSRPPGRSAP